MTGLPSAADRESRRHPLPLAVLAAICCAVGAWSLSATELLGESGKYFPLLLAGMLLGFIALCELRVGLAVLLLAIGLSPEFTVLGIPNFRYEDAILPVLLVAWLARHILCRERLRPTDLKVPLLIIVFVSMISSLNNHIQSGLDLSVAVLRFGKSIEYYLIFLLVLNTLRSRADVRGFVALMLLASLLVGILGIAQWSVHGGGDGFRVPGPTGETANILGGYYVFHICIALGLLARARSSSRPLLLLYLALMLIPIGLTLSRTSYVALIIGILTIWGVSRSGAIAWPIAFLLLIGWFIPETVAERFGTIAGVFSGDAPSSWQARVAGWEAFIPAALERPLFGHGVGSRELGEVDSEYVLQLYSLGVVGLGAFLWLISRCLRTAIRIGRLEDRDPTVQGFALGYLGGTVALLAHSIAATTFTTIRTTEPFFFATGILYVIWNRIEARRREDAESLPDEEANPVPAQEPAEAPWPQRSAPTVRD